jgi:AcrR family transcriptional regulator
MATKSPSIRENPRPDLRRKLLDSAERLFSERAYDDVRVDDIAADAGVAKGLVYYHFEGKRGIYIAVIKAIAEDVNARTVPDLSLPFYDSVAASLDSFLAWTEEIERFSKAVARGPGTDPVLTMVIEETLELQVERVLGGMKLVAAELDVEGVVETPIMRHAIKGWVAFVYGVMFDWMTARDVTADELRDLFVRALAGAIKAGRDSGSET